MNTLYTITINSRKYVTTDPIEAVRFAFTFEFFYYIEYGRTTETIPNVIAV